MNPVTPSSIALTAATRRTVHGRLPLPVWTAWTALAAAGVLAGAALLPRAAHAQVGANAPARIGVVGPFSGPSADFAAFIKREQAIWSDIVKRAGIKAD